MSAYTLYHKKEICIIWCGVCGWKRHFAPKPKKLRGGIRRVRGGICRTLFFTWCAWGKNNQYIIWSGLVHWWCFHERCFNLYDFVTYMVCCVWRKSSGPTAWWDIMNVPLELRNLSSAIVSTVSIEGRRWSILLCGMLEDFLWWTSITQMHTWQRTMVCRLQNASYTDQPGLFERSIWCKQWFTISL